LLLPLVLLCGCNRPAPKADFEKATRLLKDGDMTQALAQANAGLKTCGSPPECWNFRLLKAEALLGSGQSKEALEFLDTSGNPPDRDMQTRRLMHQGQAWFRLADFPLAEKMFKEAHDLAEAQGGPMLLAEIELRQGALLLTTKRFEEADATLRRVLDVATRGGDPYLQAQAMGNLGKLFMDRFQFDEAIYWFQRAYKVFIGLGSSTNAAKIIGNLGWCSYQLGNSEEALKSSQRPRMDSPRPGTCAARRSGSATAATSFGTRRTFPRRSIDTSAH